MSRVGGDTEINIKITGDPAEAGRAFDQVTSKAGGFAASLRSMAQPLRAVRTAVLTTTQAFFGWFGIIGIVSGAVTGLITLLHRMWRELIEIGQRAEVAGRILRDPMLKSIEQLQKATKGGLLNLPALEQDIQGLAELDKKIATLEGHLTEMQGTTAAVMSFLMPQRTAEDRAAVESELALLRERRTAISDRISLVERSAQTEDKAAQSEEKRISRQQTWAERAAAVNRLLDERAQNEEDARRAAQEERQAETDYMVQLIRWERERAAENKRNHEEAIKRVHELRREFAAMAREQQGAFGTATPGVGVTNVSELLKRILETQRRIEQAVR